MIGGDEPEPAPEPAPATYVVTVNNGAVSDETGATSFAAGTQVTVTANDRTAEGVVFNGWFVDSMNATLDDPSAQTVNFEMPEGDVTLTAQYQNAQPETPATYGVTVNNGTVSDETGATSFAAGAQVTVTANDRTAEGYTFTGWTVDSENAELADASAATTGFTMPEGEVTLTAVYQETPEPETPEPETPKTYEVVVENGTGSGTYEPGATVQVEAESKEGEAFQGWEADAEVDLADPSSKVTTFTMPEEGVVVTAAYAAEAPKKETPAPETYSLTIKDGTTDKTETSFAENTQIKITATIPEGKRFVGWTATVGETAVTELKTMIADPTAFETMLTMPKGNTVVTAVFEDITYTVNVANGTLSSAEAVQAAEDSAKWTVKANTAVTITANPNPSGQAFTGWKITDEQGKEVNPTDLGIDGKKSAVTMTLVKQNLNFTAQYEGIQYKVITNDGEADYETAVSGTVVTITADEAPEGMEFDYWKVDSGNVALADALSETTSFTMPTADVTVSAFYRLAEYSLYVENGTGNQDFLHMGDAAIVKSNYPASGMEFKEWVDVSGNVEFDDASRWKTSFAMPGSDVTVKATYKYGPSANDNKILDIVAGGEYYKGDTIKFTASGAGMGNTNPNPGDYRYRPTGYQIGNVSGSWKSAPYTTSMSIKATGEYTLKVMYSKDVFDGSNWVADGTTDTKSVTFRVVVKAAGVATGDETPIGLVLAVAGVSCVLFILLLILFIKRRKNRE